MNTSLKIISAASLMALAACGGTTETGENADDFAARIGSGGDTPVAQGTVAPTIQETKPGAAPGPFVAGTQTDPQSACGANLVGSFIGKLADDATRIAVQNAATSASDVRFIGNNNAIYITPDPASQRLNLMLDNQDIIRDARCG